MGCRGTPGVTAKPDWVPFDDGITAAHQHFMQMTVVGFKTESMIDDHQIPVSASPVISGILHDPVGGGPDRFVVLGPQVDTGMKLRTAGDGMNSPSKGTGNPLKRKRRTVGDDGKNECQLRSGECDVSQTHRHREVFVDLSAHHHLQSTQPIPKLRQRRTLLGDLTPQSHLLLFECFDLSLQLFLTCLRRLFGLL